MSEDKAKSIFLEAVEKHVPHEWPGYLDKVCDDPELRRRVEKLLDAHRKADSVLDAPAETVDRSLISERPGSVIGRYKLMEEIGEGGMGVVFVAEQQEPVRRKVALKIIKPGMDTKEVIARFEAERQALALMEHPNIARVLDAGATESGRPYFVMELVRGIPIAEFCDKYNLTTPERLELFLPVCHAIQHAHQKGIIHRDIKPTNVLVTQHDGTPVPKVIDFGVAKAISQRLTERTVYTRFAQLVGTPMYMSPEQAEMSGLDIDTRSDVYSLGVLLYELLTGTTPFDNKRLREAAYDEFLRIIREEEPPKPSTRISTLGEAATDVSAHRKTEPKRLGRLLRGELDWIVMKALEKDRTRRYETANGFAADVRRYLDDEPVLAGPPSTVYRFRKFARRNKVAMVTVGLVAAALLLGVALSTWQAIRANGERVRALAAEQEAKSERDRAVEAEHAERHQRQRADEQSEENRRLLYVSDMNVALGEWREGDVERVLRLLQRHRPGRDQADLRGFEWYYLWRLCQRRLMAPTFEQQGRVSSLAFSPDGKTLAAGSGDGTVKLSDVDTGQSHYELRAHDTDLSLALSPDGRTLATAGVEWDENKYALKLWDTATGELKHQKFIPRLWDLVFSPDGRWLAVVTNKKVKLLDAASYEFRKVQDVAGGEPRDFQAQAKGPLSSVVFSADGRHLAFGDHASWDVTLWDLETNEAAAVFEGHESSVLCMAVSPDGNTLASAGDDGTVRLWDIPSRAEQAILRGYENRILSLAFSPDGRVLATGGTTIKLWDMETGDVLGAIRGHGFGVSALAFSPDGEMLASGGEDKTVRLWRPVPDEEGTVLRGHSNVVRYLAFSPDGATLASCGDDNSIKLWDALTGVERTTLPGHPMQTTGVAFSPDGSYLASVGGDFAVQLWDATTGMPVKRLRPGVGPLMSVAFAPEGKTVAVGSFSGRVALMDMELGAQKKQPARHDGRISRLAFSPDGQMLAIAIDGGTVQVREVATGRLRIDLEGTDQMHGFLMVAPAFSPDGGTLACGSADGTVKLFDAATGGLLDTLDGHSGPVTTIAYSPDGATLISAGVDGSIRLWNYATRQERATIRTHTSFIWALAVSSDGSTLASAGGDKTVRLWRAAFEEDRDELATCLDLEARARAIAYAGPVEQQQTVTDIEARLTSKIETGLTQYDLALANSTAWILASRGDHELAVDAYGRFAKVLVRSEDQTMRELAKQWKAAPWQHRGRFQTEQKQWDDAIASFTEAMALNPDDWRFPAQRGGVYTEARQWEQAANDLSAAIELGGDAWSLWAHCGKAFAMLGRWEEAADDIAEVVEHTPADQTMWRALAALQLQAGDAEAYKRTCQEAFPRFSDSHFYAKARLVQMSSLGPDCGIDRVEMTQVADSALSESDNNKTKLAKGMNEYRSGRFDEALAHLPSTGGDAIAAPLTFLFQAMAHHRLGNAERARQLLERSVRVIERKDVVTIDGPPLADHLPDRWIVWCIVDVVRREAEELIGGQTKGEGTGAPAEAEAQNCL